MQILYTSPIGSSLVVVIMQYSIVGKYATYDCTKTIGKNEAKIHQSPSTIGCRRIEKSQQAIFLKHARPSKKSNLPSCVANFPERLYYVCVDERRVHRGVRVSVHYCCYSHRVIKKFIDYFETFKPLTATISIWGL